MNKLVGEKIKQLRNEMNMTQSVLAGNELTKSMLSQIENNISNPSIKTLQYIADRLNRPISYFLEDKQSEVIDNSIISTSISESQEEKLVVINDLLNNTQVDKAQKELDSLVSQGALDQNLKMKADLLYKLGKALIGLEQIEVGKNYLSHSIAVYTEAQLYMEGAKASVELAKTFYLEMNYEESLNVSEKAFDLYYKNINADLMFEIELYHYKILILFAIGDNKAAEDTIKLALELSTKTSIYYKTDELYRLKAIFHYLKESKEDFNMSIDKALQFAEFTEDNLCLAKIYAVKAVDAFKRSDLELALEYAEKIKFYANRDMYIYYLVKAQAYYAQGKYDLAYENVLKVDYPAYEKHKFDYLNMWSSKIYEGLILSKLGKHSEAISAILDGIEKMSFFHYSKFIVQAYRSLSDVYSEGNDYQNAFLYLKKANEIQDIIDKDDTILF